MSAAAVAYLFEHRLRRNPQGGVLGHYDNVAEIMRGIWGERLRYNTMAEVPELDGSAYDKPHLAQMREEICKRFAFSPRAEDVSSAALQVAFEHRYHPVQEYLTSLPPWDGQHRLRRLPRDLFGDLSLGESWIESDHPPLQSIMVERWAISAVARAFEPGCQVDSVLILQSAKQGTRKSTFFREMAIRWGGEGDVDTSNDGCFKLAKKWIWCWDELAGLLQHSKTKGYGQINSFVTRKVDTFRPPYRPSPIDHPRSTVISGTSNPKEILDDPTGDRRWWIVEVKRTMETGEAAALAPLLWAEALHLYRSETRWYLDEREETQRVTAAEEFRVISGWAEPVSAWLASPDAVTLLEAQGFVTVGDVLAGLGLPVERRGDRSAASEAGKAIRSTGWLPVEPRPRIRGVRVTAYRPCEPGEGVMAGF